MVPQRTDVRGSLTNNFLLGFQYSVVKKTVQVDLRASGTSWLYVEETIINIRS